MHIAVIKKLGKLILGKKIIWVDIGTHFGQEYSSIFGTSLGFYSRLIKRFVGGVLLKRGKFVSPTGLKRILKARREMRSKRNNLHSIFVEANSKIITRKKVYRDADDVFSIALTDNVSDPASVTKLYLGTDSALSQGSSIFSHNNAIDRDKYISTMGIQCNLFFEGLKISIDEMFNDYQVLLRLNCEGVEDTVIYSAYQTFGNRLAMISGSLNDVKRVKGDAAAEELNRFIDEKDLKFVFFSPLIYSWPEAHEAIRELMQGA